MAPAELNSGYGTRENAITDRMAYKGKMYVLGVTSFAGDSRGIITDHFELSLV